MVANPDEYDNLIFMINALSLSLIAHTNAVLLKTEAGSVIEIASVRAGLVICDIQINAGCTPTCTLYICHVCFKTDKLVFLNE